MAKSLIVSDDLHKIIKTFCVQHMVSDITLGNFIERLCFGELRQADFYEFLINYKNGKLNTKTIYKKYDENGKEIK